MLYVKLADTQCVTMEQKDITRFIQLLATVTQLAFEYYWKLEPIQMLKKVTKVITGGPISDLFRTIFED